MNNLEQRLNRNKYAVEEQAIADDMRFIILEPKSYCEEKYFSRCRKDTMNMFYPADKIDFQYTMEAYNCAYEMLLEYRKSDLWTQLKLYYKSGWNK